MSTKHTGPPGLEKMHSDFRPPLLLGQWRGDAGCTCHGGPTPLPPWSLAVSQGQRTPTHPLLSRSAGSPPPSFSTAWSGCFWLTDSSMASSSGCEAVGRATLRRRRSVPAGTIVSLDRYEASLSS